MKKKKEENNNNALYGVMGLSYTSNTEKMKREEKIFF
jgi:hypothetical protein